VFPVSAESRFVLFTVVLKSDSEDIVLCELGPVLLLVPELAPATPAKPPARLNEVPIVATALMILFIIPPYFDLFTIIARAAHPTL
jgi:hypothetical protein